MPRRKRQSDVPALKPVPEEILDQFVADGPLTAQDIEAGTRPARRRRTTPAISAMAARPIRLDGRRCGRDRRARDRAGSFEPVLIPRHERRFTGFDDKILALYARGLPVREIQKFLSEMYAVEVSPDLVSTVTEPLGLRALQQPTRGGVTGR